MNMMRSSEIPEIFRFARNRFIEKFTSALENEDNTPETLYKLAGAFCEIESEILQLKIKESSLDFTEDVYLGKSIRQQAKKDY